MNDLFVNISSWDSYCKVDIDELSPSFDSLIADNLTVLNINIRSLKSNYTLLTAFLSHMKTPVKVLVVTESFLDDSVSGLYNIPGYKMAMVNRTSLGGGFVTYVHHALDFTVNKKYTGIFDTYESLFLTLKCPDKLEMNIFCFYRPPNLSLRDFTIYLESLPIGLFRKNTVMVGDLNVCPDRDKTSAGYMALEHFLVTKGFRQLVKLPTYYSYDGKPSILDHVWTNVQRMSDCFIFDCPLSDLIPVIACFDILSKFPDADLYFRNFSLKNKRKFVEDADTLFF